MPEVRGDGYRISALNLGDEVTATIHVRRPLLEGNPLFTLAEALAGIAGDLDELVAKEAICHED
jgi:hypothetical protein